MGDSLTAGDDRAKPWVSLSEDFAFGFHKLEKKDFYLSEKSPSSVLIKSDVAERIRTTSMYPSLTR